MVGLEWGKKGESDIGGAFIGVMGREEARAFKLYIKRCGRGFGKGCSGRQDGVEPIADGVAEGGLVGGPATEEMVAKAVKMLSTGADGSQRGGEEGGTDFTADGNAKFRVGEVVV